MKRTKLKRRKTRITKKEVIGDATLYLGDCNDVLPTIGRVDAVVTSPPYNTLSVDVDKPSGFHKQSPTWWKKQDGYFDQMPEEDYQEWQNDLLHRMLDMSPVVWINHKIRFRDGAGIHPLTFYDAPLHSEVVWQRGGAMPIGGGRFAACHEYFFAFGKPDYWDNDYTGLMTVWKIPPRDGKHKDNDHPCPYPEALVAPIILASTPPGTGIVLDPFLGSGTTGEACMKLNRKFIGIETEEKWFDMACRNIERAMKAPALFVKTGKGKTGSGKTLRHRIDRKMRKSGKGLFQEK